MPLPEEIDVKLETDSITTFGNNLVFPTKPEEYSRVQEFINTHRVETMAGPPEASDDEDSSSGTEEIKEKMIERALYMKRDAPA